MTEIEFQKMPLWDLPIPPPREALADDNLSLAAHRWIPGDPIPYDQMRAILGLPDVRDEVMRTRLGRFAESVSGQPYAYNPERFPPEPPWTQTIRFPSGTTMRCGEGPSGFQGVRIDDALRAAFTAPAPASPIELLLEAVRKVNATLWECGLLDEPDTRTPKERALPRPSTTPPMWANDPTRTRRQRNR